MQWNEGIRKQTWGTGSVDLRKEEKQKRSDWSLQKDNWSETFFKLNNSGITRGHSLKLLKRQSTSEMRQHFSNRVVTAWNTLDDCIVTAPSLNTFTADYQNWIRKGWAWSGTDVRWAPEVDTGLRHGLNHAAVTGWSLNLASELPSELLALENRWVFRLDLIAGQE